MKRFYQMKKGRTFHCDLGELQDRKQQRATSNHCEQQQVTTSLCDSFHLLQSLFQEQVQEAQEELLLQEESLPSFRLDVHIDTGSLFLLKSKQSHKPNTYFASPIHE